MFYASQILAMIIRIFQHMYMLPRLNSLASATASFFLDEEQKKFDDNSKKFIMQDRTN